LLQEERVAGGADDDLLELRLVALACEVADEQAALLVAQDRQRDGVEAGPAGPRLEQVRPDEAAEEDRRRAAPAGEVREQVEERRLGPVDVVEEDHQRLPLRERLEQAAHGPEDLLRRRVRVREPEQAGEALPHELAVLGRGEQPDELLTRPPGRLGGLEPGGLSNDLDRRQERDPLTVRMAAGADEPHLVADLRQELEREPRLADPRRAADEDEPASPLPARRGERLAEHRKLGRPADERGVEAAGDARRGWIDAQKP